MFRKPLNIIEILLQYFFILGYYMGKSPESLTLGWFLSLRFCQLSQKFLNKHMTLPELELLLLKQRTRVLNCSVVWVVTAHEKLAKVHTCGSFWLF